MAATGKVLGTVTSVVGEAKATAADGTVRVLQVGDVVHSDEVITTSAAGAINIALESGKTLDCGANTDLSLHESILGLATATAASPAAPGSVEALQQAIAAGQDPSQIAPATAAGGAPGAGGPGDGGGGTPVVLEQANTSSVVTSGFPTEGGTITFPVPEFESLGTEEEEQAPAVSVSVQVQVQVQVEVEVSIEGQPNVVSGPAQGGVFAVSASGDAVDLIEGTMEGTLTIPFVITLDKVFETDVQVTYQVVPDSASTPTDFFDGVLTATITIPAGQTSFTVPIQIVRDHVVEANESFHIVLIDAVNATINPDNDSASVTIFNDDANPVANNDANWAQEDVHVTAAGNVLQDQPHAGAPSGSFADAADTDFEPLSVTNPGTYAGTYGTLVLNGNGSYTYTLNNGNAAVQALDTGETLSDSFSYSATDGFNTPDSATLTVTIFGSNDAPTVAADTNWSKEDTNTTASGNVLQDLAHAGAPSGSFADHADSDTDVEPLTTSLVSSGTGSFGSLVLNSDGSYTYTLNNGNAAVQALDDGETLTDTFTYAASDGTTSSNATLTVTIFGSNDAPTVAADTNWSKEDTNTTATGNVLQNVAHAGAPSGSFADHADSDTDVEPLTTSLVSSATGSFGSLVLNSDGSYTYTLNNGSAAVQALDDGETLTDTFTYAASDGTTSSNATLTVTIFGSNDAPTVAADTNWSKEDTNTTATGNVLQNVAHAGAPSGSFADHADSDTDVEPLTTSLVSSATGSFGSLVLNSDGSYTYTLNNGSAAVQALDDGETLTDTFTYAASDGTTSSNATLTVTIFGTNDAPTVAADTNWSKEDTNTTATGNVLQDFNHPGAPLGSFADHLDSDVDVEPLTTSLVSSATGSFGSLVLNSDGSYTYTLNNGNAAVQALDNGETLTDSFTYAANDGTTSINSTLTITIFGTNDGPGVQADTNWTKEEGPATASGNVLQDVNHPGAPSGSFADHADTDADADTLTTSLVSSATGSFGSLVLNSDGSYTYTLNNANAAVQGLDTGETLTDTFTYAASDGTNSTNSTLTITIFGTNDAPTVAADTNWSKEDTNTTASGNVLQDLAHAGAPSGSFADHADSDTDVEPLTTSLVSSGTGSFGSLVLNSDGSYTYTLNNGNAAVQALDDGETLTDTFTYAASDGTTSSNATLTVTIFGSNDAPTVAADTNWSKEDTNTTATGNVLQNVAHAGAPSGSFADHADSDTDVEPLTTSLVSSATGSFGSLVLNSDGSYTYTLNNGNAAVQALDDGETLTDTFTYAASDGTTSSNATLTVTIFGSNDAPTVAADTNWSKEDTNTTATGNVLQNVAHAGAPSGSFADHADSDTDVEPLTTSLVSSATGSFGSLVLNSDGSYTYTLNNGSAAVQALDDGETLTDTFTYAASDGTTSSNATLTVTIFGTNDAPTIDAQTTARVSEEGLAAGNPDATGSSDTTNSVSASGTITVADTDIEPLTVTLSAPVTALSSNGVAIAWTGAGTNTLVGKAGSTTIVTISVENDGDYTVTLSGQIDHATLNVEDEKSFSVGMTVSDGDASAQGTLTVIVEDDSPAILGKTNLVFANDATPSGSGIFDYSIGADARTYTGSNSDFSAITLNGNVGGFAITSPSVSLVSESATSANFNISFTYQTSSSTTDTAAGTLVFDKVAGTYTVTLSEPLIGFSTLTTSQALGFQGYTLNTSTPDNTQPDVSVAQLANNFFVQFTGVSEPGGGTGANNLKAVPIGADTSWQAGDLFTQAATWVSTSNTANGVAGDTIQQGEVLDLDFFATNPTGFTALAPTAQASAMFLKFDGYNGEDMLVILKLVDPDDNSRTTKAIMVESADVYTQGATIPGGYTISLDSNDGAVIIESNDFNTGSQNYVIEGAQVLVSTEGVNGTAINLNSNGASTTTQAFDAADNDVVKISDIGFVTSAQTPQTANLNFGFTVSDADSDASATQTLNVIIQSGSTFTGTASADSIQGTAAAETMVGGGGNDIISGNGGKDTFDFNSMSDGNDHVTDFTIGDASVGAGDVLDLGDVLPGATAGATLASQLSGYVTLDTSTTPGSTIVMVDADGGGNGYQPLVTLDGVTGVSLQQLLNNHQLIT